MTSSTSLGESTRVEISSCTYNSKNGTRSLSKDKIRGKWVSNRITSVKWTKIVWAAVGKESPSSAPAPRSIADNGTLTDTLGEILSGEKVPDADDKSQNCRNETVKPSSSFLRYVNVCTNCCSLDDTSPSTKSYVIGQNSNKDWAAYSELMTYVTYRKHIRLLEKYLSSKVNANNVKQLWLNLNIWISWSQGSREIVNCLWIDWA